MNLVYMYGILGSQTCLSRSFQDTHTGKYFLYCCISVSSAMVLPDDLLCIGVCFRIFGYVSEFLGMFQNFWDVHTCINEVPIIANINCLIVT